GAHHSVVRAGRCSLPFARRSKPRLRSQSAGGGASILVLPLIKRGQDRMEWAPARSEVPTATRRGSNGGEARSRALAALPDFGSRVVSASAVVAYVAVGAAAILGRSVTRAVGDALAWVLPRDGERQQSKV